MHHDDVMIMETFSHHWPFVREIHRSPVDPSCKGSVMRVDFFSFAEQAVKHTIGVSVIWNDRTPVIHYVTIAFKPKMSLLPP